MAGEQLKGPTLNVGLSDEQAWGSDNQKWEKEGARCTHSSEFAEVLNMAAPVTCRQHASGPLDF